MGKLYPESRVEIGGLLAKHYGLLLNVVTVGRYKPFIRRVAEDMRIKPTDKILDLGAGSGYNTTFIRSHIGKEGSILGLEIGEAAISKFQKRLKSVERS